MQLITAASDSGASIGIGALFLFLIIATMYFVPTIVAVTRHHHQTGSIVVINLLLGWTFIGWGVALAMACGALRALGGPG